MTKISQAKELGLSSEEYKKINLQLGRKPNITELGIFSAMWSEHCSYKSLQSKWLKTLCLDLPHGKLYKLMRVKKMQGW